MRRLLVAILPIVATLAACAEPDDMVIVNRSDAAIAFLPGIVVQPCSQAGFSTEQVEAAQSVWEQAVANEDESWIPADAVPFTRGLRGSRIGAPRPLTVIISGVADPRVVDGPVPADAVPECGGAPLGIS